MLLALKLTLVPALIACVTLAARRWGPVVGGLLTALPVVAGPALCFYAFEEGKVFAAGAARATLLGLAAVAAFCLAYAWSAIRASWYWSLLAGWLAFAAATLIRVQFQVNLLIAFVLVLASLLSSSWLMPPTRATSNTALASKWDLPLRMFAATALVLTLTSLAGELGPELSGALTPFPVATAVIAAFTHAQGGSPAVTAVFRGVLPGLGCFALFCLIIAATLRSWDLLWAFGSALGAQLVAQTFVLLRINKHVS